MLCGGARRTVREAMTTYGLSASSQAGLLDRLVDALPWLPRPLLLSLRNTFRRKGRLGLTLATLTLGGAIFIAMLGVRESLYWEINESFGAYQSDVNVEFARLYRLAAVQVALADVPGITAVEGWRTTKANVPHASDAASDQIVVYAPPVDTALRPVTLLDGRWLQPTDAQAIVVDNHFTDLRPEVGVGDVVRLRLNERETAVTIVGIFRLASNVPNPITYVNAGVLTELAGGAGEVNSLRLITDRHDLARQEEALAAAQTRLAAQGYEATLTTGGQIIAQQRARIDILITLLLLMGLLIALVGGLGLMGTMGMNVLERTREIGVLRAVGATNGAVFQMVIVEGALIGLISWTLSAIAAVPITQFLDNRLGEELLTMPIVYIFSLSGLGLWLVGALLLATIASLLPARSAVRLTVRDTLAYE
ncbi:MAG: FtsX-like permease family protein [Chloroflexi bacterium]|nr:FtsX-like permease family protein [Chloroflexota bacterium]